MGENTNIEWCSHTFNPWRGCDKVSSGCDNCYAETMSKRNPLVLGEWGPEGRRAIAAEAYWALPLKWNRQAQEAGVRARVFCLSLGDVWEDREELLAPRERLLNLSHRCNWLDWLFLTKRPENIPSMLAQAKHDTHPHEDWWTLQKRQPRPNWQFGISAENQEAFDLRWPVLSQIPAVVRFISAEPLLGPIDASSALCDFDLGRGKRGNLHWLIVGGESGPHARPMHPRWARSLRDQCQQAGVAYFFKQWGCWRPSTIESADNFIGPNGERGHYCSPNGYTPMRFGDKHSAGRLLDGRQWNEFPEVAL